jgi:hypothetical protein
MAINDQVKAKILAAVSQLDHSNDDHWADSLPRTSIVQRIAKDQTITKAQILEAAPGFARQVGDAMGDPPEGFGLGGPQVDKAELIAAPVVDKEKPIKQKPTLAECEANIAAAKSDIDAAMRQQKASREAEGAARRKLDQAVAKMAREYPPMSHAELVQGHLKHANAEREARVVQQRGPSPLDFSMSMGGKRPRDASGSRGQRGFVLPDGRQVFGQPRRVG